MPGMGTYESETRSRSQSAKDRRTRLYSKLVNRRPNQLGMFAAGNNRRFMQTYSTSKGKYQKYMEAVTFDDNGRQVTMPKAEFNRMVDMTYGTQAAEREHLQRAFYRERHERKSARKRKG